MKILTTVVILAAMSAPAAAELVVRFDEGAPKDRFSIVNTGACAFGAMTVKIDLNGSAGGLIFDVTGQGAGVEVFQPLELVAGRDVVAEVPNVADGDTEVSLKLTGLGPNASVAFTIDVDDTAGRSETMVNSSEISGASVVVSYDGGDVTGSFDAAPVANVPLVGCNA